MAGFSKDTVFLRGAEVKDTLDASYPDKKNGGAIREFLIAYVYVGLQFEERPIFAEMLLHSKEDFIKLAKMKDRCDKGERFDLVAQKSSFQGVARYEFLGTVDEFFKASRPVAVPPKAVAS